MASIITFTLSSETGSEKVRMKFIEDFVLKYKSLDKKKRFELIEQIEGIAKPCFGKRLGMDFENLWIEEIKSDNGKITFEEIYETYSKSEEQ